MCEHGWASARSGPRLPRDVEVCAGASHDVPAMGRLCGRPGDAATRPLLPTTPFLCLHARAHCQKHFWGRPPSRRPCEHSWMQTVCSVAGLGLEGESNTHPKGDLHNDLPGLKKVNVNKGADLTLQVAFTFECPILCRVSDHQSEAGYH